MDFDRLNRETRDWNNGISRSISPTEGCHRMKASDILNNWNNHTYYGNNGTYSKNYY